MALKLDKKQGFGHISGEHHGATYEQNGHLFDANGDEVVVEAVVDEPDGGDQNAKPAATVTKAKTPAKAVATPAKSHKKKVAAPAVTEKPAASPVDSQLAAQGL